ENEFRIRARKQAAGRSESFEQPFRTVKTSTALARLDGRAMRSYHPRDAETPRGLTAARNRIATNGQQIA
ncbi:MAG: hypothetical protein AAB363_08915, partial [Planctomycetota bacterium]